MRPTYRRCTVGEPLLSMCCVYVSALVECEIISTTDLMDIKYLKDSRFQRDEWSNLLWLLKQKAALERYIGLGWGIVRLILLNLMGSMLVPHWQELSVRILD